MASSGVGAPERLRIALIDVEPERAGALARALVEAGYEMVGRLDGSSDLRARIGALAPDVILVAMESPDRDVLEDMHRLHRELPRPVVMFVDRSDSESIGAAVRAGVSAYVVDGLKARSVRPIVEVAIARFREFQALRSALESTRTQLEDRKVIERAKGLLMRRRGLDEERAYRLLRKAAMDRKATIADVARHVIEMAELL